MCHTRALNLLSGEVSVWQSERVMTFQHSHGWTWMVVQESGCPLATTTVWPYNVQVKAVYA